METLSLFDNLTSPQKPPSVPTDTATKHVLIFDVETQKSFQEVGGRQNLHKLRVAAAVCYHNLDQSYRHYTETTVLQLIAELQKADLVIGFNLLGFDYGVLQPYAGIHPLSKLPTLDLMDDIFRRHGTRIGLNALGQSTLGAQKSGDGLQSIQWFKEGKMDLILKYCEQDVRLTKELYEFGKRHGHVLYQNPHSHQMIKLDVSW